MNAEPQDASRASRTHLLWKVFTSRATMMPMFSLSLYVGSSTEYLCVLFPFAMPGALAVYPCGTALHLPGAKLLDQGASRC